MFVLCLVTSMQGEMVGVLRKQLKCKTFQVWGWAWVLKYSPRKNSVARNAGNGETMAQKWAEVS